MLIRPVRDDADFAAIAAITNVYIETTAIHFAVDPVTPAELAEIWRAHPKHPWVVAEDAGELAGYAKAGIWRARAAYAWTPELGVYVRDGLHGRGIGRALYGELLAACTRAGFHSVIAGVTLPNDASVALHEKLGFAPCGVVREAGFKLGRWWDVGFYQKLLTPTAAT